MYKINANNKYDFEIERQSGGFTVDGTPFNADIAALNPTLYHIISNHASYNAEVISFDKEAKTAEIKVNNNVYTVSAKDKFDVLLDKMGMSNSKAVSISEIKAPMPGLVLKVFVEVGAELKKGDSLFVLEAMKMENIIKCPADVAVKAIKIKPGDKVEKGQILMMF